MILAPLFLLGCSASTAASPGGGTNDGGVSNNDAGDAATANIEWIAEGGSNEKVVRIAVNGTHVAWTAAESRTVSQPSAGSVRVWPKSGGAAKSVWSGAGDVNAIAADEAAVYWLVAQKDATAAVVYRAKLPDGAPEVLSDAAYGAGALAIDATRVFFRSGSSTFSVLEKTGGAAPRTFNAGDTPFVLQPFDETVFVMASMRFARSTSRPAPRSNARRSIAARGWCASAARFAFSTRRPATRTGWSPTTPP